MDLDYVPVKRLHWVCPGFLTNTFFVLGSTGETPLENCHWNKSPLSMLGLFQWEISYGVP